VRACRHRAASRRAAPACAMDDNAAVLALGCAAAVCNPTTKAKAQYRLFFTATNRAELHPWAPPTETGGPIDWSYVLEETKTIAGVTGGRGGWPGGGRWPLGGDRPHMPRARQGRRI
jgi:hypothetical protein